MSSKKKSKANKFARMTEDERQRYIQHRAAMEEEAQRRKQQLVLTFMKNKLQHESAFSRLNSAKINQQWRQILRQIKCKELKDDMETLKQRFEIVLSCKNKIIENLLLDFDDSEVQYSMQFQKHMETISKFIGLHRIRLQELYEWYIQELNGIVQRYSAEKEETDNELQKDTNILTTLCSLIDEESSIKLNSMARDIEENENNLQNDLLYKMTTMEEKYGDLLNELQKECDEVLQEYKEETTTQQNHYNKLIEKDKANTAKFAKYNEAIANYTEAISKTRIQCDEVQSEYEAEMEKLELQRDQLIAEFQKLMRQLDEEKQFDRERLKVMTVVSNGVIKELSKIANKGEKILQFIKSCKKMEKSEDSFTLPSINRTTGDGINEKVLPPYDKMDNFWDRYNALQLKFDSLKEERKSVLAENKDLREKLKQYMISIREPISIPPRKFGF